MLRVLSYFFFAAAAVRIVMDWMATISQGERFEMALVGDVGFRVHQGSLQLIQPLIERYVAVWLWDSVLFPVIMMPLAPILIGLGLMFWLFAWRQRNRNAQ